MVLHKSTSRSDERTGSGARAVLWLPALLEVSTKVRPRYGYSASCSPRSANCGGSIGKGGDFCAQEVNNQNPFPPTQNNEKQVKRTEEKAARKLSRRSVEVKLA